MVKRRKMKKQIVEFSSFFNWNICFLKKIGTPDFWSEMKSILLYTLIMILIFLFK